MAEDPEIKRAMAEAARIIETLLKSQAGKMKASSLAASIEVVPREKANRVTFTVDSIYYGKYLDMGTMDERANRRGAFDPNPGVGVGGIKPRFWTTINAATRIRIKKIMEQAVKTVIRRQLSKAAK